MKNRLFVVVFSIVLCFSFVSAQDKSSENRFEASVIIEKPEIVWSAKTAVIKVKVTNLTKEPFSPSKYSSLKIRLEKKDWTAGKDEESAIVPFPANSIEQGKSIEVDVDLKKLKWTEYSSTSSFRMNSKEDPYSPLLIGKYYIFATIGECLKSDNVPNVLPKYLSCDSEKVLVNFKPFDFK